MQVKVFHIRLTKDNLQKDQELLNNFMSGVSVRKTATELITGHPNFWSILVFYTNEPSSSRSNKISVIDETELTTEETETYEQLKIWRQDKASELNVPNFMVCHNSELMTIAKLRPQSFEELSKIKGFGEQKIAKLGDDIIALLNSI